MFCDDDWDECEYDDEFEEDYDDFIMAIEDDLEDESDCDNELVQDDFEDLDEFDNY